MVTYVTETFGGGGLCGFGGFLNVVVCGLVSDDTVVVVMAVGVTLVVTVAMRGGGGRAGGIFLPDPPSQISDDGVVALVLGTLVPSIDEHSARAKGVASMAKDIGVVGGEDGLPVVTMVRKFVTWNRHKSADAPNTEFIYMNILPKHIERWHLFIESLRFLRVPKVHDYFNKYETIG